jgi:hypothetical protein
MPSLLDAVCAGRPDDALIANGTWGTQCADRYKGDECAAICDPGFSGTATITCLGNGVYGPVNGSCKAIGKEPH